MRKTVSQSPLGVKFASPLVSAIIPVFNAKPFLQRCLDSVLGQAYENFEIIAGEREHASSRHEGF